MAFRTQDLSTSRESSESLLPVVVSSAAPTAPTACHFLPATASCPTLPATQDIWLNTCDEVVSAHDLMDANYTRKISEWTALDFHEHGNEIATAPPYDSNIYAHAYSAPYMPLGSASGTHRVLGAVPASQQPGSPFQLDSKGPKHSLSSPTVPPPKVAKFILRSASQASKNTGPNTQQSENKRGQLAKHNLVEKQYRNRLNAKFEALLKTLPKHRLSSEDNGDGKEVKVNKGDILHKAMRYIMDLERECAALRDELKVRKNIESYGRLQ
ncbi:hypothetical protein JX265_014065 [Neoarthrinium moseri]|uniref:BHLH domain-containing protein n=1 Tax=Neoarthrinium moseri TaxID=1658444 RepID=A0A9P9W7I4_9PEZI|nr:hypothetical protein JX265_014065 [Neoarthrinium moseri]